MRFIFFVYSTIMGGGLMQLVAYGAQDAFLTGNPEITFFKVVYRRHTNFAMESIVQDFNGNGSRRTCTISRNGDLITNCWLEGLGNNETTVAQLINSVDLEIGGQRIDRHYGEWMDIWTELSCGIDKSGGKKDLIKAGIVPLEFFFCRNPGLALPLIALQYHEVKITFEFVTTAIGKDAQLYVDYIYLDTDERRRFAQVQHNMLIDQLQMQEGQSGGSTRLNFNHPCKEIVWKCTKEMMADETTPDDDKNGQDTTLKLNGHDRFSLRGPRYFQQVQPYQHHTNCGDKGDNDLITGINVYSFALKPEEHQPSGTCNFSRIDNAALVTKNTVDKVYAVNYNVLRIMSGMGKHSTAHNSKLPSWIHRPTMMDQQCNSMVACAC